jgi:hypothetical protein
MANLSLKESDLTNNNVAELTEPSSVRNYSALHFNINKYQPRNTVIPKFLVNIL